MLEVWNKSVAMQDKQMMLVSLTVSRREHDVEPEMFDVVYDLLLRYTSGVFAHEGVFAAVGQERGTREKRLHMQAAAGVRSSHTFRCNQICIRMYSACIICIAANYIWHYSLAIVDAHCY